MSVIGEVEGVDRALRRRGRPRGSLRLPGGGGARRPGGADERRDPGGATKASELAQLISTDTENEQIAGEHFDRANIMVGLDLKRVATLRSRIRGENRAIVAGRHRVQAAAIQTYVDGDITSAQFSGLLAGSLTDAESLTTYAEVATTSLHAAVVRLDEERAHLVASEAAARTRPPPPAPRHRVPRRPATRRLPPSGRPHRRSARSGGGWPR